MNKIVFGEKVLCKNQHSAIPIIHSRTHLLQQKQDIGCKIKLYQKVNEKAKEFGIEHIVQENDLHTILQAFESAQGK
ncbi:hypothetical protein OCO53_25535 [Peribacillus frigoritolerans]|uniref:hypothetical protein n=1 Tax=Peribacillus frigoritolerans TaxID=450367 RepID=UPI0021D36218|nr:hypothetical protein [Peribacillus frigoritolerans]MCU6603806.1 hypothetical protein [Peribacillus frigoritolerans]